MEWLNYHHLLYFWMVVRAGSIHKAAAELRISPPAVSTQVRILEASLGVELLARSGRRLALTDMGRTIFGYADEIFSLGRELMDVAKNRPVGRPMRVDIGLVDVLPKMVAHWLIEPALKLGQAVRIVCREAAADVLLPRLATHDLDVVLSDSPLDPTLKIRAYTHPLGSSGVTFVATTELARRLPARFPKSLDGAPMVLPTDNTGFRRSLDLWFEAVGVRPMVLGEFEDSALLRVYGQYGVGVFPVPAVFEKQLRKQEKLKRIGSTDDVQIRFYAISGDRKIMHPAVLAICNSARRELLRPE